MYQKIDQTLGRALATWVKLVQRRARLVIALEVLATVAFAIFTVRHLGVNMDHKRLIDPDLPFQRAAAAFTRYFPSLDDSLLVVIDADTPELARDAADALARRLASDGERFSDVHVPGAGSFFEEHALLYRSAEELDDFSDHLARLQPVIADLTHDGSIANLARLIRLGLEEERQRGSGAEQWSAVLDRVGAATVRVFDEYPLSISWESLIVEGSALDQGTRQVLIAEPVLDFNSLLAAGGAIDAIRAAAAELTLHPERGVQVRITGNPALNYEEMLGLVWDIGVAGAVSFALVTAILFLAFRALRLVCAAALTLLAGLVWTAAFAAVSVGQLNLLSIAFGVLFIGLGVDFAIHLGMHYADAVQRGAVSVDALSAAAQRVGSSLVLCTLTTMIGFFAFLPTPYKGVAELGLISGAGMLVIFFQTCTLFPALVTVLLGDDAAARVRPALRLHLTPPRLVARHPGVVALVSLGVALGGLGLLPHARFDFHVVNMRDPGTESVQAFNDLLARSVTSPWYANVLAPDLAQARRVGQRVGTLDVVESTLTLGDYVPVNQEEKLEILADAAFLLDAPPVAERPQRNLSVAQQVDALRQLHAVLDASWLRELNSPLAGSARQLRDDLGRFLERIANEKDAAAALADLERLLLGSFPAQIARLRRALDPPPITLQDLPAELSRRMLAADGHARVQIFPRASLRDGAEMARFVDGVRSLEPEATGVAVNLVEFGRATVAALRQALLTAVVAIALLLLALWRRMAETVLVLTPVILAAVLTGALMVLLDIPFNFTNVVVLPLLLGIGVDSGIHLVYRAQFIPPGAEDLLETTTARAVFFSVVTTIVSFGSLAFAAHRGIASMGLLLVCGMLMTLACNLVALPALLALRHKR